MLTFLGAVLRVSIGFVVACLAAGLVQVLFAVTPAELVNANDDRLWVALNWALLSATQILVFAAPFALLAALISELQGVRSFAYYALVAMAIAVAGFGLLYATETPTEATIVNSYAMAAYLTSGFVGGLVYWLFAGRLAHAAGSTVVRMESDRRVEARSTAKSFVQPTSGRNAKNNLSTADKPAQPGNSGPVEKRQDAGKQINQTEAENRRAAQQPSTGTVPATKTAPPQLPKLDGENKA